MQAVAGGVGLETGAVLRGLEQSPNVCDQRKLHDLLQLQALGAGMWHGVCGLLCFAPAADRCLLAICGLRVAGEVWSPVESRPVPCREWVLGLAIPHRYPLSGPGVLFLPPAVPFNSHVVHASFPAATDLSAELQEFMRNGHGHCCYLRKAEWSRDAATHTLAAVVWQVSRILTLSKIYAEANSLNRAARDHALRLTAAGQTPLGPALPCPYQAPPGVGTSGAGAAAGVLLGDDGPDDVEWLVAPGEEQAHA